MLNTIVMIPAGVLVSALTWATRSKLTAGSPSLRTLLQLEKHVTTVVIIVEVVDVIND